MKAFFFFLITIDPVHATKAREKEGKKEKKRNERNISFALDNVAS